MQTNIFYLSGILGLSCIIIGTLLISSKNKKIKKYTYPFLLAGGIFLEIYSIYIQDTIFIILQAVYIIVTLRGLIKIGKKNN